MESLIFFFIITFFQDYLKVFFTIYVYVFQYIFIYILAIFHCNTLACQCVFELEYSGYRFVWIFFADIAKFRVNDIGPSDEREYDDKFKW